EPASDVRAVDLPAAPDPAAEVAGADPKGDPNRDGTPAAGERRSFFAPEPAPADLPEPPASPRPRIPMFEDVAPGNVRPAWPIAPAANWPVTPRGGTEPPAPGGPTAGRHGDPDGTAAPGATRPEPAPRPRHRALPDLGRSNGWDAFANARHAGPTTPPPGGEAPDTTAPDPDTTGPALPAWGGPAPEAAGSAAAGRHADMSVADVSEADAAPEAAGGKAKARRGLFRRNRGKGGEPAEVDRGSEPLAAKDEEYVDWVAGLASDDDADGARSLRTGRHHRD
ncbi:hypothetical protein ABZV78_31230, partial [Micromonospora sp. NPDC004540]